MRLYQPDSYSSESGTRDVPLLLSERSRALVLAALENLDPRFRWETMSDAEWDEIEGILGEVYTEIMEDVMPDFTPVGIVSWLPSPNIPDKWLKVAGQTLLESDYPELYVALPDYQFVQVGTGLDIIILPDLGERFLYGTEIDSEIGDTGGATTHTLTIAEMPAHVHDLIKSNTSGTANQRSFTANPVSTGTGQTQSAGGDGAHNNMPPFIRGYWIIKAIP